jgi:hypothetical protein
MQSKTKNRTITVALSILGAGLLVILLRAGALQVQAAMGVEASLPQVNKTAAQNGSTLPELMVDSFDSTFTTTYAIQRAITHTGSATYGWGRVVTSSSGGFTDTLWSVGGGSGTPLDPDTHDYPNNVTTTITYGPIDLRQAVTVELEFRHWISTAVGDGLEWGTSPNGSAFAYTDVTPGTAGSWEATARSSTSDAGLASLLGRKAYLSFRFHSDGSQVDRGVFLDDIRVRAEFDYSVYLPVVPNNWFQEYTYQHNFNPPASTWTWPAGYYFRSVPTMSEDDTLYQHYLPQELDGDEYGIATAIQYSYGYLHDSDGSDVYYISVEDNFDHVFLTGPASEAFAMGEHWEYEAWMRRATDKDVNLREYGILISPTPLDPKHPKGDGIYTFHIRNWDDGYWLVKKWEVNSTDDHPGDEIEGGTGGLSDNYKTWNQFRIERDGDTLRFKIDHGSSPPNWSTISPVYTMTDPNLADTYYVGFFAANNEISSWREWQFDNVYVHAAPE